MRAIIASKNKDKIEGARKALSRYYDKVELIGVNVSSDVSEQPLNEEILEGARNRIKNLKKFCSENKINADLYLSIESGMTNQLGIWQEISIAIIESSGGIVSVSTSGGFELSEETVYKIKKMDEKAVIEEMLGEMGEKKGLDFLTKCELRRYDLIEQAFILGLIKIIHDGKWK